ncbi:phenylalanine ammonium lyase [Macrolepiota fuliginosa MF-IS2]|uniref:Phenylalanine ammonium lyase n=1 Tax=Macrolepiota fuliginosa MF-IS2 TaxID=1400762 RepID=A0A9P6C896_9AGAR|nr:phenylalanine ammonium lyase [Macrolepiota fuliginosa MF-IS2]
MTLKDDNRELNGTTQSHAGAVFANPPKAEQVLNGTTHSTPTLLSAFLESHRELQNYQHGVPVRVDGQTLSLAGVVGVARHSASVILDDSPAIRSAITKSRNVIDNKVNNGTSIYGLSTGFGGSADTRTDQPILLGHALLQHQHIGVLPTSEEPLETLPLLDPSMATTMPESWVRGAMLIRMNSLIRGHSGVRWEIIEKMNEVLKADLVPRVPLRGSISASGDLSPLSYVAGAIAGNPAIRVFCGPRKFGIRQVARATDALSEHGIEPIALASKEHLGILNGTAFSASVGALAIHEAVHLSLLSQVCTAMGTEALLGARGSFDSFIHATARPHPGQVECAKNIWDLLEGSGFAHTHEKEVTLKDDQYTLRQDRYPLRTSPQFLGPQIEDLLAALNSITQECNSSGFKFSFLTTDNPLIDGETGHIHHGGNFQAMAVTNAMEKTRLALHHIGKIMFAQSTELINPAMNRGLPPSLAATDPSLNYHVKGVDIATAAYTAELGYLASPVSTHIQSAEMHNQAVNSMALVSARATINAIDVLSILMATYLYNLCQALDLRALQVEFTSCLPGIIRDALQVHFASDITEQGALVPSLVRILQESLDRSTTMDNVDRMEVVADSTTATLVKFFADSSTRCELKTISEFCGRVSSHAAALYDELRKDYLTGVKGSTPASPYLSKTKTVYEYIRETLGVRMHGFENFNNFANGLGVDDPSIGENISIIYEAIRDGKMQNIVVSLFD